MTMKQALGLLTDDKFKIALLALVASCLTLVGVPEAKQSEVLAVIGSLAVVLVAAKGYEQGKLNEGTVPDGSKPAAPSQNVTILTPPAEGFEPIAGGGDVDPQVRRPATPQTPTGTSRVTAVMLLLGLCFAAGGCATSEAFKAGMRSAAPLVANEGIVYTAADTTLNVLDTGTQTGQATRLKDTAAADCNYTDVKAAWLDVRPWYVRYVEQDKRLTDAVRPIILKTASQIDALIAEEGKRRSLLFLPE